MRQIKSIIRDSFCVFRETGMKNMLKFEKENIFSEEKRGRNNARVGPVNYIVTFF